MPWFESELGSWYVPQEQLDAIRESLEREIRHVDAQGRPASLNGLPIVYHTSNPIELLRAKPAKLKPARYYGA